MINLNKKEVCIPNFKLDFVLEITRLKYYHSYYTNSREILNFCIFKITSVPFQRDNSNKIILIYKKQKLHKLK